ncbi:helix-turn-helix domain-containing protein [Spongiibacter sp. KMU-166]|uniref:Helix-turn-helix domain-containing protein n=1 Tax=Spongiibacter thalassae TaxID=2721624 RepID=A0ABX1GJX9_9GAMM|nr:helix-turn-helix domain-containing protein [Spongiibacter thalassae]NKI18657.1 helix-turn-helix domain-containing protein [Spongiibacter thalassae]
MNTMQNQLVSDSAISTLGWQPRASYQLECFREWKDFVRDNFPWLEFKNNSRERFSAEVSSQAVGSSSLSLLRVPEGEVKRTRHLAELTDHGLIKIMWQLSGSLRLEQDKNSCILMPGQATVCDSSRPYKIEMSEKAKFAVLMLPHSYCAGWEHISESVCGTELYKGASSRSILGTLMALTAANRGDEEDDVEAVLDALQTMVTKLLYRSAEQMGVHSFEDRRLNKARDIIVRNISNSHFGPDELASEMCMSRRSLYMLFEEIDTTPVKMIREIRLEAAMRVLLDSQQSGRKITDIAFDSGFNEYATFTRLFKSQFGKTPSEFRNNPGRNVG